MLNGHLIGKQRIVSLPLISPSGKSNVGVSQRAQTLQNALCRNHRTR